MSQIRYKQQYLDQVFLGETLVEDPPTFETVLIKEEIIDSKSIEKKLKTETCDWSDDDFFTLENSDETSKPVVIYVDEKVKDEEIITESKELKDEKIDFNEDKYSSTESEPDLFVFDEQTEENKIKKPKNKYLKLDKQEKKAASQSICHICGKSLNIKRMEYHLNCHNGEIKKVVLELKFKLVFILDIRPFVCKFDGCDRSFHSPVLESRHRKRHSRPSFDCNFCEKKCFER